MTEDNQKNIDQKATKSVSSFLYGLIVYASAGLVVKLAWNLGVASLFPGRVPNINYAHAITWLAMLYIMARVIAAGIMAEVERTIANLVDQLENFVEIAQDLIDIANSRSNASKNTDDSDLN